MGSCIVKVATPDELETFNNLYLRYNGRYNSCTWNEDYKRWQMDFIFVNPLDAKLFYDKIQNLPNVQVISFDVMRTGNLPVRKTKEENSQSQNSESRDDG